MNALLIDQGNTRCKFAYWDGEQLSQHGVVHSNRAALSDLLQQYSLTISPTEVYLASVAGEEDLHALCGLLHQYGWQNITRPTSEKHYLGLSNAYKNAKTLGIDRWLAMIAAWQRYHTAVCVVDCGSALTIDVIDDSGKHMGGVIIPGHDRQLMLANDFPLVHLHGEGDVQPGSSIAIPWLGRDTASCVSHGAWHALVGATSVIWQQSSCALGSEVRLVLTGGGAEQLIELLPMSAVLVPHLVLEGLSHYVVAR